MSEIEQLQAIIRDQTRMLIEKNRCLADLEYQIRAMVVTGSRKEDLARLQSELNKETIEGQSSLFQALLETVPCGVMVFNAKGIVITSNPKALALLKIGEDKIIGKDIDLFLHPCRDEIEKVLEGGEKESVGRLPIRDQDGDEVLLSLHISPILNSRGELLGGIALLYGTSEAPSFPLHDEESPERNVVPYLP